MAFARAHVLLAVPRCACADARQRPGCAARSVIVGAGPFGLGPGRARAVELRDEVLVLPGRIAGDFVVIAEAHDEGIAELLTHPSAEALLLPRLEPPRRDEAQLDVLEALLAELVLPYRRRGDQRLETAARQERKPAAAPAGRAELGEIADLVADERHGEVVERRDHDLPHPARGHRPAGFVQGFDERDLGLDVIMLIVGALQRKITGLARAVDVADTHIPGLAAAHAYGRVEPLGDGDDFAQLRQTHAAAQAILGQIGGVARKREQIVGVLAHQPFDLLLDGAVDVERDRRTMTRHHGLDIAPRAVRHSVGVGRNLAVRLPDPGELAAQIAPLPDVVAERHRLPKQQPDVAARGADRPPGRTRGEYFTDLPVPWRQGRRDEIAASRLNLAAPKAGDARPGLGHGIPVEGAQVRQPVAVKRYGSSRVIQETGQLAVLMAANLFGRPPLALLHLEEERKRRRIAWRGQGRPLDALDHAREGLCAHRPPLAGRATLPRDSAQASIANAPRVIRGNNAADAKNTQLL